LGTLEGFGGFSEGSLSVGDVFSSESEFIFTFGGLSFIELVVGELFSLDFSLELIEDSGDGVHWSISFHVGFNLGQQ